MVLYDKPIVVLGAGLCGLTAARELARAGLKVVVLEAEQGVGGLARTVHREGHRVDLGSHRLHPAVFQGELGAWLDEICGDILMTRPRKGRLRLNGSYIAYPPSLLGLLGALGFQNTCKCFKGWVRQKAYPENFDLPPNYESYIVSRVGREAYRIFYRPYALKVWRIDPTLLSIDEVKKRVITSNPVAAAGDALKRLVKRGAEDEPSYLYPKGGIGMIAQRLAEDIKSYGGRVETGVRLCRVGTSSSGLVDTVIYDKNGSLEKVPVSAVAGTIPLPVLRSLLDEPCPDEVSTALEQLSWRSLRLLYWQTPGLCQEECETLYFPEIEYPFGRVSVPRLFDLNMGVPGGGELISLELPCGDNEEIWRISDTELLDLMRPLLEESEVIQKKKSAEASIFSERVRYVYPLLGVNWRKDFATSYFWVRRFANLYPIGRQGLFLHNNMDQSITLGLKWARGFLRNGPVNPAWDDTIWSWAETKIRD